MHSVNQILALVAIVAYLSATFLPCEKDVDVFARVSTRVGTHAVGATTIGTASSPHPSQHVADEKTSHQNHQNHQNHEAHHGAHQGRNTEIAHHRVAIRSALVWMPTCLCGCGDTRATVGGGAARLGRAVPSTPLTPWPTDIARAARIPAPRPIVAPVHLIDPIPT